MIAISRTTPVVIIGAGPVGLAAAAHLHEYGLPFLVVEAGPQIGDSVRHWGHVQLFSPWRYSIDRAALRLLETTDWEASDPETFPTGDELVDQYLAPLAALPAIAPYLRLNQRVVALTRVGIDKLSDRGRADAPFLLHVIDPAGNETLLAAAAVIDASGTYRSPNPLGAAGVPAVGERAAAERIFYGIPAVLGAQRSRYAGKRVLVAGSGHSAFNALLELAELAEQVPGTQITWAVRRSAERMGQAYGGGVNDALPARGALGARISRLVAQGAITLVTDWRSDRVEPTQDGLVVHAGARSLAPVDEIVVTTGLRPDLGMLAELRLGLDPAVEAPTALAPLIDPNLHSCGTVRPHGVEELTHPEPNFYIAGMKSYGRAPTFLMLTGYEQVRSIVAGLAGDWEAARRVELELPETGVCSGPIGALSAAGNCCGPAEAELPAANLISLSALPVAASCCTPIEQVACCAPEEKADCCGVAVQELSAVGASDSPDPAAASGCGCR